MRTKWAAFVVLVVAWSSPLRADDSTKKLPIPVEALGNMAKSGHSLKARLAAVDALGTFQQNPASAELAVKAIRSVLPSEDCSLPSEGVWPRRLENLGPIGRVTGKRWQCQNHFR